MADLISALDSVELMPATAGLQKAGGIELATY